MVINGCEMIFHRSGGPGISRGGNARELIVLGFGGCSAAIVSASSHGISDLGRDLQMGDR